MEHDEKTRLKKKNDETNQVGNSRDEKIIIEGLKMWERGGVRRQIDSTMRII